MKLLSGRRADVLLFDSAAAASDMAFMLGGQWDGCNGIVLPSSDKVAVNTAANFGRSVMVSSGRFNCPISLIKYG